MLLQMMTWPEVEAHLAAGNETILVPIGSTEQHGPTGLIGTDALCADHIAAAVGRETGTPVAPVINVGMAQHHMAFPGTMTLRPSTLIAVIRDRVLSLAAHGFRRFHFVNGHGGNIPTIKAAWAEIHADTRERAGPGAPLPGLRFRLDNWFLLPGVRQLAEETVGDREGHHATVSEVAVTQHLFPDHIKTAPLNGPAGNAPDFHDPQDFRRKFPDGRMASDPSLATPDLGRRFFDTAVGEIAEACRGFVGEG